jgi:hypothetical protein
LSKIAILVSLSNMLVQKLFTAGGGWALSAVAKVNVVFLCQQVRWQNTSFNFAKRLNLYSVTVG